MIGFFSISSTAGSARLNSLLNYTFYSVGNFVCRVGALLVIVSLKGNVGLDMMPSVSVIVRS